MDRIGAGDGATRRTGDDHGSWFGSIGHSGGAGYISVVWAVELAVTTLAALIAAPKLARLD